MRLNWTELKGSTKCAGVPSVVHRRTARRASMGCPRGHVHKSCNEKPTNLSTKSPDQICDSHPDVIKQTTNVHLIPPFSINTDIRKQTRSTKIQTKHFPPPSLHPSSSSPQTHPSSHIWNTPSSSPLAGSLKLGSSAPSATNFIFRGFSQHSSSRSPREGMDTCRDRAINASGRGHYGQAKAGRAAKATHGTQVPS